MKLKTYTLNAKHLFKASIDRLKLPNPVFKLRLFFQRYPDTFEVCYLLLCILKQYLKFACLGFQCRLLRLALLKFSFEQFFLRLKIGVLLFYKRKVVP